MAEGLSGERFIWERFLRHIWKKAYLVNTPTVSGRGFIWVRCLLPSTFELIGCPWELTTVAKVCKKFDDVVEIVPNQGSTRIKELLTSDDGGVAVVVAWFVSVAEGVDCWFLDVNVKSKLRFRMKLKVNDGEEVAIFSLFDSDVECLSMETCSLLNSMGESCSLFPDEMECFFRDAILYKVEKDCLEEDEKIAHFKVISMCNEVDVVNKFTDEYLSIDENFELALPLYLAKLFHPVVAVLLSVTFVLAFGEVIPQAICTRYRLYVGATFIGLVRVLVFICYPIAYPIGKWTGMANQELLDYFISYAAQRARHSYGPQGHQGMSVLIFEASAGGYLEAERLHKHFTEQRTDKEAWFSNRRILFLPGGNRQLYGYMATEEDLEFFNRHCQGKTRLKYEMKSYQEMVVNQIRQMSEDNQQLLYFKNKVVKEKKHSKAMDESFGIVTQKLRKTMEENRIVRRRTKMQHEEIKEENNEVDARFCPVYRAKLAIQDESSRINLEAFDHALLPVATVNPKKPGIPRYYFPRAFDPITGKNIMYIVEKRKHNPTLIGEVYELLCVSDDPKVINHFVKKGFCNPPSKMHFKFVNEECNLMKPKMQDSIVSTTDKVFADYMVPMAALSPMCEPGESSEGGARLSTIQGGGFRSVRARLS
ncbi:protein SUPPRESSOR OF GENE SILENCING [Trifolium repens]|nr:protein SUPPRESSOR OF GENE SILENCING [Trifolium repens]